MTFIYNFNVQNLVTLEDYIKFKGDIPLSTYIDFETNAPADMSLGSEDKNMFAISYITIFAFHPYLKLNRVIIEGSFGHSLEKLTSLEYLRREHFSFRDKTTLLKLRDCALAVSRCKDKFAVSNKFSTELKFAGGCLLTWFYKKQMNLELDKEEKMNYKISNPYYARYPKTDFK